MATCPSMVPRRCAATAPGRARAGPAAATATTYSASTSRSSSSSTESLPGSPRRLLRRSRPTVLPSTKTASSEPTRQRHSRRVVHDVCLVVVVGCGWRAGREQRRPMRLPLKAPWATGERQARPTLAGVARGDSLRSGVMQSRGWVRSRRMRAAVSRRVDGGFRTHRGARPMRPSRVSVTPCSDAYVLTRSSSRGGVEKTRGRCGAPGGWTRTTAPAACNSLSRWWRFGSLSSSCSAREAAVNVSSS